MPGVMSETTSRAPRHELPFVRTTIITLEAIIVPLQTGRIGTRTLCLTRANRTRQSRSQSLVPSQPSPHLQPPTPAGRRRGTNPETGEEEQLGHWHGRSPQSARLAAGCSRWTLHHGSRASHGQASGEREWDLGVFATTGFLLATRSKTIVKLVGPSKRAQTHRAQWPVGRRRCALTSNPYGSR